MLTELGNLVDIKTGRLDANANVHDGQYPFFTCSKDPLRIDQYSFDGDYVLVAGNGDLNVKHYVGKFDAYQRTYAIKSNAEKLNSRYLYYFLSKYIDVLRNQSIGGVIKYIKIGNLTEAKIPLPPLAEQKQIAAILDAADSLRQKDQQLVEHYTALSQSLFLEMFGDPISWLSENVGKDWLKKKIRDIALLKRGYDLPVQSRVFGGIDIFASNGIVGRHNIAKVKGPGVITGRSGTIGKVMYTNDDFWPLNTSLYVTDFNNNNPIYIYWFLTFYRLHRFHHGAGVPTLNRNLFLDELSYLPPLKLQNQFAERIAIIEEQKQQAQANLQKSEALFNSLLQRAFTGELTADKAA